MAYEIALEVLDGEFSAGSWADTYGDVLSREVVSHGGTGWNLHRLSWGVVFELAFPDETSWEAFRASPSVIAALDAVPDRVLVTRGWGGSGPRRSPRRRGPMAGAGGADLPEPVPDRVADLVGAGAGASRHASGASLRPLR